MELQRAAYAVEAELIGFGGIPPMHESVDDVRELEINWVGAFAADELIGGLGFVDTDDYRLIDRLFVDPRHARRGAGRRLVASVINAHVVRVSTGSENYPANALYESLGFEAYGLLEIAPGVTVTRFALHQI
ncbi:MAG: GNAT family N-acetyltransferase [bacterium]|nr:GNAT family N-acetyltransferase [bacterium]